MGQERGARFEVIPKKAYAASALLATAAYFADRYGINFAVHHGLTEGSGLLDIRSYNNFLDTLMTEPVAYIAYSLARTRRKPISRKAALGLTAAAMLPGAVCNVASEVSAVNNTYPMQHVLPEIFRSEPGTINNSHRITGGAATLGIGGTLFESLRRLRKRQNESLLSDSDTTGSPALVGPTIAETSPSPSDIHPVLSPYDSSRGRTIYNIKVNKR